MVILGLDISTNTIGYAFLDKQKILEMGFIDISKTKTMKEKAMFVFDALEEISYFDNIGKIYVEDSLSNFAWGKTSTQTIIKLAKFNAVLCFVLEWGTGLEIKLINPNTARKVVFGKARQKGKKAKDFVKEQIEKKYKTQKWIKITKRGNFDKRNIDAYDATVCALYHSMLKSC